MRWLLVDGIDTLEAGKVTTGHKTWSPDEEFFQDHFPSFPVVSPYAVLLTRPASSSTFSKDEMGSTADCFRSKFASHRLFIKLGTELVW